MAPGIRRRSSEIIADLIKKVGCKNIAEKMRLSEQSIYKWGERSGVDEELPFEPSGRANPIDRTADLLHIMVTEGQGGLAVETINWLARELGGLFITDIQMDSLKQILQVAEQRAHPGDDKTVTGERRVP